MKGERILHADDMRIAREGFSRVVEAWGQDDDQTQLSFHYQLIVELNGETLIFLKHSPGGSLKIFF
ncbi:MAG: hypothetical protein UU16_C0057G0004 [Candidatus Woesebacteria bacterium GW2011_GWA2_40_7]|uniref:Uncharacterized protein n=3 Tax=Candidatus Woeseibacteriota TaxID=1752722 RepID=A0A0G0UU93_9BACT|nr:MAG: hypothetical protein UT17_C0001G0143 [Candidatus Woesebacteria bacterium GW2011_GWB1_39_10]KKR71638.1 MAG: hypothetical protein UU16_C0057G0004 [Candidatus Woesebacteria bacterium GW2011_GWA2_40_7]KKR92329.1 MAG: hypothetical protein UU42_C0002G0143 [Candidatus Woesebacteria bacterium GW2011_GWA1_41_13b]